MKRKSEASTTHAGTMEHFGRGIKEARGKNYCRTERIWRNTFSSDCCCPLKMLYYHFCTTNITKQVTQNEEKHGTGNVWYCSASDPNIP